MTEDRHFSDAAVSLGLLLGFTYREGKDGIDVAFPQRSGEWCHEPQGTTDHGLMGHRAITIRIAEAVVAGQLGNVACPVQDFLDVRQLAERQKVNKGVPLFTLKICHALSKSLRASSVLSEIDNHLFLLFVLIKIGVVDVQQPN